jgi:hypothetical protein
LRAWLALAVGLSAWGLALAPAQAQESSPPTEVGDPAGPVEDDTEELGETTSVRRISAAQAIAELERARRRREALLLRSRITNLMTYDYLDMRGPTEEAVLTDAGVRALVSTASRLYFDDHILIGRDLLEPYLRNYGDRFLTSRDVIAKRIETDGTVELDVTVGVNVEAFYDDLAGKHFIGQPTYRPILGVTVEEIVDGKPTDDGRGRKILEETLRAMEQRVESEKLGPHPLNVNVMETPEALRRAREEAQRGKIEVLVTGRLEVRSQEQKRILFDEFTAYDAGVQLYLIRVDTGEVIGETSDRFGAPALADEMALERAYEGLMPRTAKALASGLLEKWRLTVLDMADYRLMVTGVDEELLESVFNLLKTLSPEIRAYVKSFYGDVAVINVYFPEAKPGQMLDFLRKSRVPQFDVRPADDRKIELRIL